MSKCQNIVDWHVPNLITIDTNADNICKNVIHLAKLFKLNILIKKPYKTN